MRNHNQNGVPMGITNPTPSEVPSPKKAPRWMRSCVCGKIKSRKFLLCTNCLSWTAVLAVFCLFTPHIVMCKGLVFTNSLYVQASQNKESLVFNSESYVASPDIHSDGGKPPP